METEKLKKCSNCGCNKLLKYFKLRENTGELYKTCMQCCEKGKKKKKCKCGVIPYFGFIGDIKPTCCSKCKSDDMVNIVSKKCKCNKSQPSFGMIDDEKPTCCSICKSDDMVDIKNKKCICGLFRPSFGFINDKKPTCCLICKSDDMVDIKNKKCKSPMCDTRANPKYRGYCSRCFFFTFPDEPLTRNYKSKENSFIKPLHAKFSQYDHSHDKIIKYGCSKKRPDNITDFGSHVIVVEVDEYEHKNYECEMLRMMLILNDIGGRPIIFIRLNCDSYKIDGKRVNSPFSVDKETGNLVIKNKKEFNTRLEKLFDTFEYYSKERGYKTFQMVELFY